MFVFVFFINFSYIIITAILFHFQSNTKVCIENVFSLYFITHVFICLTTDAIYALCAQGK